MLGKRRGGNHGFLSCSRLLNCLPKTYCRINISFVIVVFLIYKQPSLEAVKAYNLIAIMYFLKKEEILNKNTGDDEVIYHGQSEGNNPWCYLRNKALSTVWRAADYSWKGHIGGWVAEISWISCIFCYLLCNYSCFWTTGLPTGGLYSLSWFWLLHFS